MIDDTLKEGAIEEAVSISIISKLLDKLTPDPGTKTNLTVKLSNQQRIMLRKFECFAQSLDWNIELNRNEAVLLLIEVHGGAYNTSLKNILTASK
ncbi:MAG: hypothetical protein V7693_16205 [Halopseudomonas sabulinigri]